ncbi:MAG: hypothetical protein HQL30_05420 [Candidatus Omnitrophica bacterium]|nr:hypothetical protein [Candidatus Omnitrophota bacterium]
MQQCLIPSVNKMIGMFRQVIKEIGKNLRMPFDDPLVNISDCEILAGPGLLGLKGGLFNPGAVVSGDEIILIAKGLDISPVDAFNDPACFKDYMKGPVVILRYDLDMAIKKIAILSAGTYGEDKIEDFRVFNYRGNILSNHVTANPSLEGKNPVYGRCRQSISRVDVKENKFIGIGNPRIDRPVNMIEKNWCYFEHNEELFLLYSLDPYLLFKLADWETLEFKVFVDKAISIREKVNNYLQVGKKIILSLSTNPISYDEHHYLMMVHKAYRLWPFCRLYVQWAMLIDKKSLLPVKVSRKPVFTGKYARGSVSGVIYTTSVLCLKNDVLIFNGEGDSYLSYARLSRAKLNRYFVDISA